MKWQALMGRCFFSHQVLAMLFLGGAGSAAALDFEKAPPAFSYQNGLAVPINFYEVEIDYTFNIATSQAIAHAVVTFDADQSGYPILDLVPNPTRVKLNSEALMPADLPVVSSPGNVTRFRVLNRVVAAGSRHVLEIDYALGSDSVTFTNGRARAGFFMSDLATSGREFFELYGPANYEFDQVHYKFRVHVVGAQVAHEIFTNAALTDLGSGEWALDFPEYFTASSLFFHLTEVGRFNVQRYMFAGLEGSIPVTVYSDSASRTASAVANSRTVMTELESTYGAFAHDRLVIYMTPDGGGMEYCGATMTEPQALDHELTHSWFARGVMPTNANSGWIDEAVASWRDNGYPRAMGQGNRLPVNLGGFSRYRRHTTNAAYTSGARLISELDFLASARGGLRPVLRSLFAEQKRQTITVQGFKSFLEMALGMDLSAIFNRYVYGQTQLGVVPEASLSREYMSKHPRPYSKADLAKYR